MKILNNTTGRVFFSATWDQADGQKGAGCGWIEPHSPPYDFPFKPGWSNVTVTMKSEGVDYADLTNETFVQLDSSAMEASVKAR